MARHGRDLALLGGVGAAIVLADMLLSHPIPSVFYYLVAIAEWLQGGVKPDVVTWPAWGYAWVILGIPKFGWIVALQSCLGALVLTALVWRLRPEMPRQVPLIAILCVLAVPWHNMQLTLYPSGLAGSLLLTSLMILDSALRKKKLALAGLAGVLMGLAQNLRTEFVLLPVFIGVCIAVLRHWRIVKLSSMRPVWVFILVAVILQLPWAIFYHGETGRYSLTESNFGHVMFVSLGSSLNNPWKITGNDLGAMQAVHDAGFSFSSLSEPGNQVLRRMVWANVKQHPDALLQRTLQQLLNTVVAPFNWGEPKLDKPAALDLDVLRQELKARIGSGINAAKLSDYRNRNLYAAASEDGAAKLALLYQIAAVGLGSVILVLGILGMVLALIRGRLAPGPVLLWLLAGAAVYKILQDVLLAYQLNYLDNVYPMFLPFVAVSSTALRDRFGRRTPGPIAGAP